MISHAAKLPANRSSKESALTETLLHAGHRARMRKRLLATKEGQFPPNDLLECLLMHALPRIDTKPLARQLIQRFGTIGKIMMASPSALRGIAGVGDAVIVLFRIVREIAFEHLAKPHVEDRPVLERWEALMHYLRARLGHSSVEEFFVLYLDKRYHLIASESHAVGTVDMVAVFPREIVKSAVCMDATSVIVVHNHPTGDTRPSKADIFLTEQLMRSMQAVDIRLHDHVIIGASSEFSFKNQGLMEALVGYRS